MAKSSLPDLLNNPALRSMAEGMMQSNLVKVVQPFVCDACNANIAGDRFNSSTNPDFDLCKSCMESAKGQELEKEHKFKRITALEALIATLRNGGTFDAFFAPGTASEPEPAARHHAICDVCNQSIVGVRHRCLDCADYDECNVCHLRPAPHVDGHVFHAMPDPSVRAVPEEVALKHRAMRETEEASKRAAAAQAEANKRAAEAEAEAIANKEREAALLTKLVAPPLPCNKVEDAVPVEPVVVDEKEPSAFERNLQTLESMGFSDRKRNIQVLVRNRNKLFESIQELLG